MERDDDSSEHSKEEEDPIVGREKATQHSTTLLASLSNRDPLALINTLEAFVAYYHKPVAKIQNVPHRTWFLDERIGNLLLDWTFHSEWWPDSDDKNLTLLGLLLMALKIVTRNLELELSVATQPNIDTLLPIFKKYQYDPDTVHNFLLFLSNLSFAEKSAQIMSDRRYVAEFINLIDKYWDNIEIVTTAFQCLWGIDMSDENQGRDFILERGIVKTAVKALIYHKKNQGLSRLLSTVCGVLFTLLSSRSEEDQETKKVQIIEDSICLMAEIIDMHTDIGRIILDLTSSDFLRKRAVELMLANSSATINIIEWFESNDDNNEWYDDENWNDNDGGEDDEDEMEDDV